jgi:hypothetical protein
MKASGVALQGALAAAGLVAAFLVWQREPAGAPGEVTVVDAPARALERLRYEDETRFVELFRDEKGDGELWVRLGAKQASEGGTAPGATGSVVAAVGSPDAGAVVQASVPPAPPPPPPPRELRANEVAQKLFARFAPLKASRGLGALDAAKLAEVGLAQSARRLTLTLGDGARVFSLASPPGGWGSPYLKSEADGHVFLLGPSLLSDLEAGASRLVDRRLHTFESGTYDTVVVTQGTASRTFLASGQPPGPTTLAPKDAPDKPDEFIRNWHERVWRLMPMDFLGRGEEPADGAPEVVFRVEYRREGKPLGELTVARGAKGEFYARTEHTPGWTRLHGGVDTLASEAARVAGGKS